jgi:hypothetical protein
MRNRIWLCGMALLAGCDPTIPSGPVVNQEIRERVFFECLARVPKGPDQTKYNDWAEVVEECGSQAYYISLTRKVQP